MKYFLKSILFLFLLIPFISKSQELVQTDYTSFILTPPPPSFPRINGATVYGVRPGHPVIYRIPCTGERPLHFRIEKLPDGLLLDQAAGILTGTIHDEGIYPLSICAENTFGKDCREFKIVVGNKIALTPPMGWNSWYIHYDRISDQLMRTSADQMIASGMADYGYQYVNIDDCWMVKVDSNDPVIGGPERKEDGTILTNKRFPDMHGLTGYIHSKGLKAGIYISPGPQTCQGYEGSYGHEIKDARTFSDWGFDFLKYDWCSYGKVAGGNSLEALKKPYQKMWNILGSLERDMVLNLCQYGMGNVWEWGGEVGNCWRTTGDLGLEKDRELPGFYYIGMSNAEHWPSAKPGEWNDPDYILIGWVGDAHNQSLGTPTDLTPYEQYAYMSMWSLMAAPLIFSGDMAKLDPFTLNVLCNHEVIEVNQDPLGKQARIIRNTSAEFILAKELEDGSLSVGLFNLKETDSKISVDWSTLKITGNRRVRDLWRQKDIGIFQGIYEANVPPHGVAMVRMWVDE